MEFGVLGPLRALADSGADVTPAAAKQSLLLAVLLCHRDEPVPADRLVDLLWDDAPASRTNLQVHVHRLRQRLGADRIAFGPAGYQLRVGDDEADDARFERTAARGHAELAAGDAAAAHHTLSEALDLWRGSPYAGYEESEPVRVQIARLTELRLVALADRLRAGLALGRAAQVVGELVALVSEHPLREELRGLLMLALHRSGRTAEALEAYAEGRRLAVDELGIEPGVELRELHQSILTDDGGIAAPRPAEPRPAPSELPAAEASFVGRETLRRELVERLRGGDHAIVAISGPGGVGKSALARQAANAAADAFPDGQLYLNLQGSTPGAEPIPPRDALSRLLRSLRVPDSDIPTTTDEAAAAFRSVTADRRLLIVLDNAADAAQVRPLLPGLASGSAVVVTSRAVLGALDVARHLRLTALSEREAVALLGRLAGADRVTADPRAAAEIAAMCDRLPLALRIAGARLVARPDWSLDALRDRLRDSTARLDELEHGDLAVRASCAVGFLALPKETARTFVALGMLHLADATPAVVAALTGQPVAVATRQLDRLVEAGLLDAAGADRYTLHDLLRFYARERATETSTPAERRAARMRVVHHQLATARAAMHVVAPGRVWRQRTGIRDEELTEPPLGFADGEAAGAWIRAEATGLVASVRYAATLPGDGPPLVAALSAALVQLFHSQNLWPELATVPAIALSVAERAELPELTAAARHDLGMAAAIRGRPDEAMVDLRAALRLFDQLADTPGQALALDSLGNASRLAGRLDDAVGYHRRALAILRARGDRGAAARTLNNLAWSQHVHGDEALSAYQEALRAYTEIGDQLGAGAVLLNLSQLHLDQDQPADALTAAEQAAAVFRRFGHTRRDIVAQWRIGSARHHLGDLDGARAAWRHALELLRDGGALTDAEVAEIMTAPVPEPPSVLRDT
ncbi:AfsR/SARP family transcriptional regulator [Jiangella alba]|uniref:DNA-binding transcriptional activator of the SARP family n=1 Tax=Jiangella alba TaxID=561176 RepID=A0A1H5PRB2_9ACTN|nr:AfsR/SARP family transcriptional regulator [Jiangella alba]SEF16285.1 DNA-binding transcriptional activator of the SARP family [Jiangella alba]